MRFSRGLAARQQSPLTTRRCVLVFALLLGHEASHAQFSQDKPVGDVIRFDSYGDYGTVGLLQMPTARMAPDGQLGLSFSRVWPYERYVITMQAMPGLEASLRYTNVLNRLYSNDPAFSGSQTYKDRSFDVKVRLMEEGPIAPEVALGIRDIAGTGLFSSEFVVANKRYFDWDFTLGIGWGYLASRGNIKNPLRALSSYFDKRQSDSGLGGQISSSNFFRGENSAIFAGAAWRTTVEGLTLKLELDGNDYQTNQPLSNVLKTSSALNVGANYSINPWVDVAVAIERGNTAMLQFVFKENIKAGGGLPKFDAPPPAVQRRSTAADFSQNIDERVAARIAQNLKASDFAVAQIEVDKTGTSLTAKVSQRTWRNPARAAGRAARAIANSAPAKIEKITITNQEAGIDTHSISLLRHQLEKAENGRTAPEEMWSFARQEGFAPTTDQVAQSFATSEFNPTFNWRWSPLLRQHIGGPDNPYFYQIALGAWADWQPVQGFALLGGISTNVYNNFAGLKLPSNSKLPHVRSDIKDYLKQGENNISRLQMDYVFQPATEWFGKLSAGIFEEMFGGVGTEWMYRPEGKRWSVAGNVYKVRQRDYDQLFSFRPYQTTTGHIETRYRWPWYGVETLVSGGQYLAGDVGLTFEISRRFESGATIGMFFTRTNVSAAQFGEGSFDKGIYITLPLDYVSLFSTRGDLNFGWRPLTRDGGQKLSVGRPLPSLLYDTDHSTIADQWAGVLK